VKGTIALEEHFVPAGLEDCITGVGWDAAEWRGVIDRLTDIDLRRLKEMDACGIEKAVLSLGTPGVQGIAVPERATQTAGQANNTLAEIIQRHPDRFGGFAALPMQDPTAAAAELRRAVTELGMCGAMVNSHSDMPDGTPAYYDDVRFWPVWETAQSLDVPVYLHPRNPPPQFCGPYQGRPELLGPTWAFAVETGTHALRLITAGVFDQYPALNIILGHLGEFLPFAITRLERRMEHLPVTLRRPPTQVLSENFYITCSGNAHTPSLLGAMLQVGSGRLLFATDYPFERMADAANWFAMVPISAADSEKIGRSNAAQLLRLTE
jgi:gamma-resorcylate decarboxylase